MECPDCESALQLMATHGGQLWLRCTECSGRFRVAGSLKAWLEDMIARMPDPLLEWMEEMRISMPPPQVAASPHIVNLESDSSVD